MAARIPANAFEVYVGLGPDRSYHLVAKQLGVHRRSICKLAKRQRWAQRLEELERAAQQRIDDALAGEIAETRLRQRKLVKAIAARAAKALAEIPLTTGMEGVRAAEVAIKLERLLAGQPSERTEMSVADVTRREMRNLLVDDGGPL